MSSLDRSNKIILRERARCEALRTGDVAALDELLSDRLVFMHANGGADAKAALLAKLEQGTIVYHSLTLSEERVTELGTVALLHSRLAANVSVGGQVKQIDNYTLSVWVLEQDMWRLIAYQPTPLPRKD